MRCIARWWWPRRRQGRRASCAKKPMAMDLAEADEMLAACRASGSRLTISHQRYYMPQYTRARQLIAGRCDWARSVR